MSIMALRSPGKPAHFDAINGSPGVMERLDAEGKVAYDYQSLLPDTTFMNLRDQASSGSPDYSDLRHYGIVLTPGYFKVWEASIDCQDYRLQGPREETLKKDLDEVIRQRDNIPPVPLFQTSASAADGEESVTLLEGSAEQFGIRYNV
ncbi:MAG: hypothetical protein M1826_006053 [Phylliscum demangeonii]|nr:MAG: hypothetical protein M1826_006053 [Phylliscum demangeonii]